MYVILIVYTFVSIWFIFYNEYLNVALKKKLVSTIFYLLYSNGNTIEKN